MAFRLDLLLPFLLLAFGVIYGVVGSSLLAVPRVVLARRSRVLEAFLYCPYCVGFWVGVGLHCGLPVCGDPFRYCVAGGFLVVGALTVLKGAWPDFLLGAYHVERDLLHPPQAPGRDPLRDPEEEAEASA